MGSYIRIARYLCGSRASCYFSERRQKAKCKVKQLYSATLLRSARQGVKFHDFPPLSLLVSGEPSSSRIKVLIWNCEYNVGLILYARSVTWILFGDGKTSKTLRVSEPPSLNIQCAGQINQYHLLGVSSFRPYYRLVNPAVPNAVHLFLAVEQKLTNIKLSENSVDLLCQFLMIALWQRWNRRLRINEMRLWNVDAILWQQQRKFSAALGIHPIIVTYLQRLCKRRPSIESESRISQQDVSAVIFANPDFQELLCCVLKLLRLGLCMYVITVICTVVRLVNETWWLIDS